MAGKKYLHRAGQFTNSSSESSERKDFIYSPTDAPVSCFKNNIKIYIKIYIKTAPTCFVAVKPSSGSALFVLTKVTVVTIVH
jgi:hypothetical protein